MMMNGRIFLAAILGAVAMFLWNFVAHMLLPLGEAGVMTIPNESAVVDAMTADLHENAGFYIFPGGGLTPNATKQEREEAMKRANAEYATKPSGILIYHPPGQAFNFGKYLGVEFATEFVEALLVVSLLAQTRLVNFGGRVCFVTFAGVLAAITTNISYWNWYGFPTNYTAGYMTTQIVGFLCAGVVIALVLKKTVFGKPVIL